MKKFINDPDNAVDEMLEGFLHAHRDAVSMLPDQRVIVRTSLAPDKVGIVTGGGSGHKPSFIGYVGSGMLDAVAVGEIFTSPPAATILAAIEAADTGSGVLCLLGNYAGDVMNFRLAADMAREQGHSVELSIANDDVGAGFHDEPHKRRGVVGEFLIWKAAGAHAASGASLAETLATAEKVNGWTRTMGVASHPCTVPAAGRPTFTLEDDELELGVGHHGERGSSTIPLTSVDSVVELLAEAVLQDLPFQAGDEVVTLINGLGATPLLELYIAHRRLVQILDSQGLHVHDSLVGEYFTALEMAGFSITLAKVDDELKHLLAAPADTPHFKRVAPQSGLPS